MRSYLCLLATLLAPAALAAPRLHLSTSNLAPESVIELVLDHPAVTTDELGKDKPNDWLEIQPAWPGKLVWKEPTVAEFIPEKAPEFGQTYHFSIKSGLHDRTGAEIPSGEILSTTTENFTCENAAMLDRYQDEWSPRNATFYLRFNAEVDPATAGAYLVFTAKNNQQVAAVTERAEFSRVKEPYYLKATWQERFNHRNEAKWEMPVPEPQAPLLNGLIVRPAMPLPIGQDWQLKLLAGLPDARGVTSLGTESTRYIGEIKPLKIEKAEAYVEANQPREIRVEFNQGISKHLSLDQINIEPPLKNAELESEDSVLHVKGDFTEGDQWEITVKPSVTSVDGLALGETFRKSLLFKPLDPGVAFPSHDEAQLASGNRQYRVELINLKKIHVRIKKLDAAELARARQGYRHYTGRGVNDAALTPQSLLPYEMMMGETVVDSEIELPHLRDATQGITLDWDKVIEGKIPSFQLGFSNEQPKVTPAPKSAAAFFLEVAGTPQDNLGNDVKSPVAQALIQLTDIGLGWKLTPEQAQVFVFSTFSGQALAGAEVQILGEDAKLLEKLKADENGILTFKRSPEIRHLQVNCGEDSYGVAFDDSLPKESLWHFPVRYSYDETPLDQRRAFLFTDRNLYRPGEKVHLKGVVRHQHGNDITNEPKQRANIVVKDPAEKEILHQAVSISELGSFDLSFDLPKDGAGVHTIALEYPDELVKLEQTEDWYEKERIENNARFSISIHVEDFRRNAFELTDTPEPVTTGAKQVASILSASYYQGTPVAKGKVSVYTQISDTNLYPEKFRDFLFGDHQLNDSGYWYHYFGYRWGDDEEGRHTSNQSTTAELGEDGKVRLSADLPEGDFPSARKVTFSTEVSDANEQTLTHRRELIVHPASTYLGVKRVDQLVKVGDAVDLEMVAITPEEALVPDEMTVVVKSSREVNDQVRVQSGADSAVRNESHTEELGTSQISLTRGKGSYHFQANQPGRHQLEFSGTDGAGHRFATRISLHVYGGDEYPWAYENDTRIRLVPEKALYHAGETARVLVLSPIEGRALITVEQDQVRRHQLVDLSMKNPVIEIPITEQDAPNVFISAMVIKGAMDSTREVKEPQLRLGYCELHVENRQQQLKVELNPPVDSVLPGTEALVEGRVILSNGTPASGAEVTLYAEDEGTLDVIDYKTPDLLGYFYDPRNLRVETGTSLEMLLSEAYEEQSFANKGLFVGGGDDEGLALKGELRKDFNPCAVWLPSLLTDADGKFRASFKLPDTLTRYRVIAIAHHEASRFGHQEAKLTVNKPIMIQEQAPRFGNVGDALSVKILVQNQSGSSGSWKVELISGAPDLVWIDPQKAVQTIQSNNGSSSSLIFPIQLKGVGEGTLRWSVTPVGQMPREQATRLSDQVEARFQINHPSPLIRKSKFLQVGANAMDLSAMLEPELTQGEGTLEIEAAMSPLLAQTQSIDDLLHYPYGCVEQTTSSLMPWFSVEGLRRFSPKLASKSPEKVSAAIQHGVNRLLSMQLDNGGFGYWPGDKKEVSWASSYAGLGLVLGKKQGAIIPESAIENLTNHLESQLREANTTNDALELRCRAMWVLALAGKSPDAYINKTAERIKELGTRARCYLALAAAKSNPELAKSILHSPEKAPQEDSWMSYEIDPALKLLAQCEIEPGSPETLELLRRLTEDQNPYGSWYTTWQNSWSLMALAEFAATENIEGSATLSLSVNDSTQTLRTDGKQPAQEMSLPIHGKEKISVRSDHPVFLRLNLGIHPREIPDHPVSQNGMEITRFYERVKSDGSTETLDRPHPGDLIRVTLKVDLPNRDYRYLSVDDPLPAIFETVNADFTTQASAMPNAAELDGVPWEVSHSELRTDRALFFIDHTWGGGKKILRYLVRCTMEGSAIAPPAKVEAMYDPTIYALSAARKF
jgi:alpha-2-macroglobulin